MSGCLRMAAKRLTGLKLNSASPAGFVPKMSRSSFRWHSARGSERAVVVLTNDRHDSLLSPMSRERSSSGGVCGSCSPLTLTVATEPKNQLSILALLSATHTPGTLVYVMRSQPQVVVARRIDLHREKLADADAGELVPSDTEKYQCDRRSAHRSRPRPRMRTETLY